jgi:hypothetical protein
MTRKLFSIVMVLSFFLVGFTTLPQATGFTANQPVYQNIIFQATPVPPATGPAGGITPSGPDSFPPGVNPLTGLPVSNPDNLLVPPALVSISNFPASARPQAGLSFSPFVYEMYIGEGMTRFLAMFYGDFPSAATQTNPQTGASGIQIDDSVIGPVRSGRLPYESLRRLYNGFLVMASASKEVAQNLTSFNNIFGSDNGNINSNMLSVTKLEQIAQTNEKRLTDLSLTGLRFDPAAPTGGKPASSLWLRWSLLNQVIWRYDQTSATYHRFQNDTQTGATYTETTDRLNQQPLAFENVIVMFAKYIPYRETLIDIELQGVRRKALLFRDGQMQEIFWTTLNGAYEQKTGKLRPIRFVDAQGNAVPLKPGQTWVEMVPEWTPVYETVDSENVLDLITKRDAGSGHWAVLFTPQTVINQ